MKFRTILKLTVTTSAVGALYAVYKTGLVVDLSIDPGFKLRHIHISDTVTAATKDL